MPSEDIYPREFTWRDIERAKWQGFKSGALGVIAFEILAVVTWWPVVVSAQAGTVRVFIEESVTWTREGAKPLTADLSKHFLEKCPTVVITSNREKAAYTVRIEHDETKNRNRIAVFNGEEDLIYAGATVTLANAVKDVCSVIAKTTKR